MTIRCKESYNRNYSTNIKLLSNTVNSYNVTVLSSGRGSNFRAIAEHIKAKKLNINISKLISDKENAEVLNIASSFNIPSKLIKRSDYSYKKDFFDALIKEAKSESTSDCPDLIVLAGFMKVLNSNFIKAFSGKIINIHPSLLPSFKGLKAQEQALKAGVKFSGCTVHLVNEDIDSGKILAQAVVPVLDNDTIEELESRILIEEHKLLPIVIEKLACKDILI